MGCYFDMMSVGADWVVQVEVYGGEGAGKSALALNAIISAILPKTHGGDGGSAVLLDLDYKFAFARLHEMIEHRIRAAVASTATAGREQRGTNEVADADADVEATMSAVLARLMVAHVADTKQLLATLHVLPAVIAANPTIRLLVIDSVSAL
jgi:RecA/RadA recombinase